MFPFESAKDPVCASMNVSARLEQKLVFIWALDSIYLNIIKKKVLRDCKRHTARCVICLGGGSGRRGKPVMSV